VSSHLCRLSHMMCCYWKLWMGIQHGPKIGTKDRVNAKMSLEGTVELLQLKGGAKSHLAGSHRCIVWKPILWELFDWS
jgi:hypothetical protein